MRWLSLPVVHRSFRALIFPLCFLCALCVLCGSPVFALDAESAKPYKLTVVLRVAEHRLLTPVFKDQLVRELRDSLQDALGSSLAVVSVVTQHPILAAVEQHGLHAALEQYKSTTAEKVHVVLVDYVDGQYEIQAAQHDGLTGRASPGVRKVRLDDPSGRQLVARTAALQIERDFGVVGTVEGDTKNPRRIKVRLKGGKLGVPLDRWVKKDEVFALVQVNRLGGAEPIPDALLQVAEPPNADGVCVCRLSARRTDTDPSARLASQPGVLGYRCLKLGTTVGPLRLRLVNDHGLPHFNLNLLSGRSALDEADAQLVRLGSTNREGFLQAREPFAHVAYVVIKQGDTTVARIPIPILEDHVAVRTLVLDERIALIDELLAERNRHIRRLDDCRQLQTALGKTLGDLLAKSKHAAALEEARQGKDQLTRDLQELQTEQNRLTAEVVRAKDKLPANAVESLLADGGRRQQLEAALGELTEFIAAREASLKQQEQVRERDALVGRARILKNREARYDEALQLYKEALDKFAKTPQLEKEYNDLKAAWALRNDDGHPQARRFIFQVWPQLDSAEQVNAHMDEARRQFDECKRVGDKLTALKLRDGSIEHARHLAQQFARLRRDREDDRARAETLGKAAEGLRKLLEDINAYLSSK